MSGTSDSRASPGAETVAGVVLGVVTNTKDPNGLGRVKLLLPTLSDRDETDWARVAGAMAGNNSGLFLPPQVHDEVLVAFENGRPDRPIVLGAMWSRKQPPPETNRDGKGEVQVLRSRSGHLVRLTDTEGGEKIEVIDHSGKSSLVFDSAKKRITIASEQDVTISATSGTIRLEATTVEIKASGTASVEAGSGMTLKSNAGLTLKGQIIDLN
jgi:uncharacterized protein involved in type VI secretion and phage assembly